MHVSDWVALGAVDISLFSLLVPMLKGRQSARITEILTVPTLPNATYVFAFVANHSSVSLSIRGATLDGVRLYRHPHKFTDRGKGDIQNTSSFPVMIAPHSEALLSMEFVKRDGGNLDCNSEIMLVLNADRGPIKSKVVINQSAVEVEQALREI